jgi:hypothetical protein
MLRGKLLMLRPLPRRMLRSRKSQHWLRRKKRRKPWLMLTKGISSESKPWLSGYTCLLLEVHTRLVLFLYCCCFLALADIFPSCCFSVPFVVQNLPRCFCLLCNRAMILLWPRLTYSKQTRYLSRRSLSW